MEPLFADAFSSSPSEMSVSEYPKEPSEVPVLRPRLRATGVDRSHRRAGFVDVVNPYSSEEDSEDDHPTEVPANRDVATAPATPPKYLGILAAAGIPIDTP